MSASTRLCYIEAIYYRRKLVNLESFSVHREWYWKEMNIFKPYDDYVTNDSDKLNLIHLAEKNKTYWVALNERCLKVGKLGESVIRTTTTLKNIRWSPFIALSLFEDISSDGDQVQKKSGRSTESRKIKSPLLVTVRYWSPTCFDRTVWPNAVRKCSRSSTTDPSCVCQNYRCIYRNRLQTSPGYLGVNV